MSTKATPPRLGDLILSVRFEGHDPQREDRRGPNGTRRYDERHGWNFDNHELLEIPPVQQPLCALVCHRTVSHGGWCLLSAGFSTSMRP
jgi:hypothetical protein